MAGRGLPRFHLLAQHTPECGRGLGQPGTCLLCRRPVESRRTQRQNACGDILFAWAEAKDGRGFVQGATLAWQVFDKHGHPLTEKQTRARAVARWSMPAAYARPDGTFVLLHDGPPAAAD